MSTILIIASVVLGCLIAVGIVFLWWSIKYSSPPWSPAPSEQDGLDLMASQNEDGTIAFVNYHDQSRALYSPADGDLYEYLTTNDDIHKATYRNGDVTGVWVADPDDRYNDESFVNGRLYIFENGKLVRQYTHNGLVDYWPIELAESEATFFELA